MIKLTFKIDIDTYKALIAACVVHYNKYLNKYCPANMAAGAAALLAYEWATNNVDKARTLETNIKFKLTCSEAFAVIFALEEFDNNHPLSLVLAQEIKNKLHLVMVANQNAYRIQNGQDLLFA